MTLRHPIAKRDCQIVVCDESGSSSRRAGFQPAILRRSRRATPAMFKSKDQYQIEGLEPHPTNDLFAKSDCVTQRCDLLLRNLRDRKITHSRQTLMFSRSMRLGAVLLALAQLGVWGFYAPAHRLMHHSKLVSRTAAAPPSKSHHCSHHHSHSSAPAHSHSGHDSHDQCPDDDQHCGLCVLALHTGCAAEVIQLAATLERVEAVAIAADVLSTFDCALAFESRGPPSV